ncbi:hypothetical protein A0H76_167 [Hepatospora eriocheir]|nr:hypothetical protein A0H76_167 [Hepatospora eriocheir]
MYEISKRLKNGFIIAYCKNTSLLISFDICFEYSGNFQLPAFFICRDERIFVKKESYKLKKSENTLFKLIVTGNIQFYDLK